MAPFWQFWQAADVCMRLEEFARAGHVVEVWSSVLDEAVVFASDDALVDPGELRTVYRAHELRVLLGLTTPRELRRVHEVKRTFRGTITDSGRSRGPAPRMKVAARFRRRSPSNLLPLAATASPALSVTVGSGDFRVVRALRASGRDVAAILEEESRCVRPGGFRSGLLLIRRPEHARADLPAAITELVASLGDRRLGAVVVWTAKRIRFRFPRGEGDQRPE